MKLKPFKKVCYGLALLAIASCSEDKYLEEVASEIDLSAQIESPVLQLEQPAIESMASSRTYIDENEAYESGVGTLWRANEVIGVYGSASKNVKFTGTNDEDAGKVSFRGFMWGTPKYAYYPYSETNDGVAATAVKQNVPVLQPYSTVYRDLVADLYAGVLESRNWYSSTFTFSRLVSILQVTVDATGTPLEGANLRSVSIKVSNKRKLTGDITTNLESQTINAGEFTEGNDSLTLQWTNEPNLLGGRTTTAYATSLPYMQVGDEVTFTIRTNRHVATFSRNSKVSFVANALYTYPLVLSNFSDMVVQELVTETVPDEEQPVSASSLKSMKFTAALNPGKILTRTVAYNSSTGQAAYTDDANAEAVCDIDTVNKKISLYLPYLNNRKLVPTFELEEGTSLIYEGGEIVNGETAVDFSQYKQVAVVNSSGTGVIFDVELTNTGLPVVVINQETGTTSTESNSEYQKASAAWYAATGTKWQPKESDWKKTDGVDNFMVYNADGTSALTNKSGSTLTEPILASTRVRGNVTQQMPKKAFAVKLDSKSGVLDMPAHKRWVLLANWKDRTLMRNAVAFGIADVFKQTFSDGLAWNPSGQFVELVYNGVHVGNYYLCEQVKIDGNRLDINDPYEEGDAFTAAEDYGYLLESDDGYDETWKFITKHYIPFLFKDDGNDAMLEYAQTMVRGVEENLYDGNYSAAYETMDLASFVDYWLIQELMMNTEMQHPKSVYSYINDGKLYAGPVWDFDWNTLPTSSSNSECSYSYTSSMLEHAVQKKTLFWTTYYGYWKSSGYPTEVNESDRSYMWYPMLVKDATFTEAAAERWNTVKGALQTFVNTQIPAIAATIEKSEAVNWSMWQIDNSNTTNSKKRTALYGIGGSNYTSSTHCGYCGDEGMTFSNAISTLTNTLNTRINGMDYVSNQSWPSITFGTK